MDQHRKKYNFLHIGLFQVAVTPASEVEEIQRNFDAKPIIPAISACIINTIFPMMMCLDLDSLGQND